MNSTTGKVYEKRKFTEKYNRMRSCLMNLKGTHLMAWNS